MNAVDVVAAVQSAIVLTAQWPEGEWAKVQAAAPQIVTDRGVASGDWAVTVELLRREYETPRQAAERLALYMTLHAERWGETPTLNGIRNSLLEDR